MTTVPLHPTPPSRIIIREQIRAVGLALRKEGIFFLVLLGVISVLSIAFILCGTSHRVFHFEGGSPSHSVKIGTTVGGATALSVKIESTGLGLIGLILLPVGLAGCLLPFGLAGFLVPFGVWRSENPSRRSYHWTMPVARDFHTLIKMLSGWLWLMLTVVVYIVFLFGLITILTRIRGGGMHVTSLSFVDWLSLLLSATVATTIVYLYTSAAVIGSNHPWRWIGGLVMLCVIGLSYLSAIGQHELGRVLGRVVTGKYGLFMACGVWLDNDAYSYNENVIMCLKAMMLWIVPGGIGVWIVAHRHGDAEVV